MRSRLGLQMSVAVGLFTFGAWVALGSTPAIAASSATTPSGAVQVPMQVICQATTPAEVQYAEEYGTCPASSAAAVQAPGPLDVVGGSCGWSSLYLTDQKNGGWATVWEAALSTDGPIVHVTWTVNWTNYSILGSGSVKGSGYQFSDTWNNTQAAYTKIGLVTAVMHGSVVTALGFVCDFNNPSDAESIT